MLNKFREDLENLLYKYANYNIKLNSLDYDVVAVDRETNAPANLTFKMEVLSDESK